MGVTDQIITKILTVLGFLVAFVGMGLVVYGLSIEKGLSNMFAIGIILMIIGAIIVIASQKRD